MADEGAIIVPACGLANRLLTMSDELTSDPSTQFFWAPFVLPAERTVVDVPFEDLFQVAGSQLPFVSSMRRVVSVRPSASKWTSLDLLKMQSTVVSEEEYVRARNTSGFAGMECRASGDKKSFAGDECSFLRRLLPPRALHEPLQRLRRQLTDQCLPVASGATRHWSRQLTLHVRNANESSDRGFYHPWRTSRASLQGWLRRGGVSNSTTGDTIPFAYAATQTKSDGLFLRKAARELYPHTPPILLQSDFREPHFGRGSYESLLSAVFDLFALSLGRVLWSTTTVSTWPRVVECLRESVYWKLSDPYASVGDPSIDALGVQPSSGPKPTAGFTAGLLLPPPNRSVLCEDCRPYLKPDDESSHQLAQTSTDRPCPRKVRDDGTWCFIACCRPTMAVNSRPPCLVAQTGERRDSSRQRRQLYAVKG